MHARQAMEQQLGLLQAEIVNLRDRSGAEGWSSHPAKGLLVGIQNHFEVILSQLGIEATSAMPESERTSGLHLEFVAQQLELIEHALLSRSMRQAADAQSDASDELEKLRLKIEEVMSSTLCICHFSFLYSWKRSSSFAQVSLHCNAAQRQRSENRALRLVFMLLFLFGYNVVVVPGRRTAQSASFPR